MIDVVKRETSGSLKKAYKTIGKYFLTLTGNTSCTCLKQKKLYKNKQVDSEKRRPLETRNRFIESVNE